jgi:hypothetical protein
MKLLTFEEVLLYKLVSLEKVTKTILNRRGVWGGLSPAFLYRLILLSKAVQLRQADRRTHVDLPINLLAESFDQAARSDSCFSSLVEYGRFCELRWRFK